MRSTPTRTTPSDALIAIHRLLHPELYDDGADPINWTAETIEAVAEIVCDAIDRLDPPPQARAT